MDCDQAVNSIDALLVLQWVAALIPTLPCPELADVYPDGQVNAIDAFFILLFEAGRIHRLPAPLGLGPALEAKLVQQGTGSEESRSWLTGSRPPWARWSWASYAGPHMGAADIAAGG